MELGTFSSKANQYEPRVYCRFSCEANFVKYSYLFAQSYEEAFEKLKEATEIEDIDLLVSKFIEVEDKNFALFNYVNELNNDIEVLQEQINMVGMKFGIFRSL